MITLKQVSDNMTLALSVAFMMLYASTALAQTATQTCRPAQVIPLTGTEPRRRSSSMPRWPNHSPRVEWW